MSTIQHFGMLPKPNWLRWNICTRLEERFDRYEGILDDHLIGVIARLMALTNKPG